MSWLNEEFKTEFIKEFSSSIAEYVKTYNKFGIYDFYDIHKYEDNSQRTQARTASLAPYVSNVIFKILKDAGHRVEDSNGYDHDIIVNSVEIEEKTFQGNEPSSGGFANKVGHHLFIKYKVENNRVGELLIVFGNIRECVNSKWSKSGSTTSYSSFKLSVDDADKFIVLSGSLRKKKKWCEWKMEEIEWK